MPRPLPGLRAGQNDVIGYEIHRSEDRFGPFALVSQVAAGSALVDDGSASVGVAYYYFVRTIDVSGNFSDSTVVGPVISTGDIDAAAPEDVTDLSAQATQLSGADISVVLGWTASVDSEGDLVDQLLYISKDGDTTFGNNNPDYDNGEAYSLGRSARDHQETSLTAPPMRRSS